MLVVSRGCYGDVDLGGGAMEVSEHDDSEGGEGGRRRRSKVMAVESWWRLDVEDDEQCQSILFFQFLFLFLFLLFSYFFFFILISPPKLNSRVDLGFLKILKIYKFCERRKIE